MFECPNRTELLASEQRRRCANHRTDAPFGMNAYVFDFRQINSKKAANRRLYVWVAPKVRPLQYFLSFLLQVCLARLRQVLLNRIFQS